MSYLCYSFYLMKNYLTFIILSLLFFGCFFKRKLVYVYPKDSSMMEVVFHPQNFEDRMNYTFLGYYDTITPIDSIKYNLTNDSIFYKLLVYEQGRKVITQEVFKKKILESRGKYYLNTFIDTSRVPIYNNRGNKTNEIDVTTFQNAYRNGVWKYFDKGVLLKEEKWNMGKLDTILYFK